MELKTLKDLTDLYDVSCGSTPEDILKAEAVKWVKFMRKEDKDYKDNLCKISIEYFIEFFNLTDEDFNKREVKEK
jgi:hypothetical protein